MPWSAHDKTRTGTRKATSLCTPAIVATRWQPCPNGRRRVVPEGLTALLDTAATLKVQAAAPKPILMGRHLIELGLKPGRKFGVLLDAAYDAQLEGKFFDRVHALRWLAEESGVELSGE